MNDILLPNLSQESLPTFLGGGEGPDARPTSLYSSRMRTARLLTVPQHALRTGGVCPGGMADPPPVNRMTDRCKNITLPQLRCWR